MKRLNNSAAKPRADSVKQTAKRFSIKNFFFLLSVVGSLLHPACVFAFNAHQPFDIAADVLDYVDETQEITARGHVVIVQSSSTLSADLVRYDRIHKRLIARGKVILREKGNVMIGDQLDYDLVQEKGLVLGGKGTSSSWFFQGTSWEKNEDYYIGRSGSFTNCDLIDPHYHIRSSRIHLIPDQLFWSWNNVFYIDDHAVMYTPFMYKYLGPESVTFQAQPGSDSLLGSFAKTTTTMRLTDHVYDKMYLDYYSVAGNGYGNELDFEHPGRYKGSLFGYYIDPHPNSLLAGEPTGPQYNFRGYLWDKVSKDVQLQANSNIRQNVSFNTQYFSQDPNQSQNDILSSIALTQQTTAYNQQLVIQREDAPDAVDSTATFATTHIQDASLPSYNFTLYSRPLWSPKIYATPPAHVLEALLPGTTNVVPVLGPLNQGTTTATPLYGPKTQEEMAAEAVPYVMPAPQKIGPILFSMTDSAQNEFERIDNRIHSGAQSTLNVSQGFPFARNWTYNTSISPQINWADKGPTTDVSTDTQKGYTGSTTFGNSLRWRPTSSLTIDTVHTLTERLKPNAVAFDRDNTDHGIEADNVSLAANLRPNSRVLFRSSSGFDFRPLEDESLADYQQRKWLPWSTDWTYNPNRQWEYYVSNQVGFYPVRTSSWQASAHYTGIHKTVISTAFVYNRSTPGDVTWNQSIGYYFGPGWRVDASINALVPSNSLEATRNSNLINTSLILVRDMHCWQTQFIYTDTPPFSRSFSVLFNLKLGGPAAQPIADDNLESQFYSWRNRDIDPSIR